MSPYFALGLRPAILSELDPDTFVEGRPPVARIAHLNHAIPTLLDPRGERRGSLSGALREDPPTVGDWVEVDPQDRVVRVLPRHSFLLRRDPRGGLLPLVANVDTVFITTSLNGDLNPRRIERFVLLVRKSGAEPVIVLTKADLDDGADMGEIERAAARAPVVRTAALRGDFSAIRPWTGPGQTVAFVGASGVGKSTLVNAWMGRTVAATTPILHDDRGQHTTTDRRLHLAPDGTLLADLPGVREVGLVGDEDIVEDAFPEIRALAAQCRWRDCGHAEDDGCAVLAAVASGELPRERWLAWRKLERERAWAARQADPEAARAHRARWKGVHQSAQARMKLEARNRW